MKKLASIVAVGLFTLGLTATVIDNASHELDFLKDINILACGNCWKGEDFRGGNNT